MQCSTRRGGVAAKVASLLLSAAMVLSAFPSAALAGAGCGSNGQGSQDAIACMEESIAAIANEVEITADEGSNASSGGAADEATGKASDGSGEAGGGAADDAGSANGEAGDAKGEGEGARGDAANASKDAADAQGAQGCDKQNGADDAAKQAEANAVEGAEGDDSEAAAAGDDAEAAPQALSEGDCFVADSDEGLSVTYKITSPTTVQVGTGIAGYKGTSVYKADLNGGLTQVERTTIDISYSGKLTIPSTVEFQGATYTVTALGASAFGCYYEYMARLDFNLRQITLPSTVTSIGDRAFNYCHLTDGVRYTSAPGVQSIGYGAFMGCYIRTFELPSTVSYMGNQVFYKSQIGRFVFPETCGISQIPDSTFEQSSLNEINLPSYIHYLGTRCFRQCYLQSIEISSSITGMGKNVFAECSLLGSVQWAQDTAMKEIPSGTFYKCSGLASFGFPAPIASIESNSFAESGLRSISIPKTLTYLGEGAFEGCDRATKVEFEEGHQILSIGKAVFKDCSKLPSIDLPTNLRDIGNSAFAGCTSLTTVRIPKLVNKIDAFAFQQCDSLDSVVFLGDANNIDFDRSSFYLSWNIKACVFYGKRSKTISFSSSEPTVYCTIGYWGSKAEVGVGEPLGRYAIPVNSVPSSVDPSLAFEGSLREPPSGYRWILEKGFSLDGEMVDSFYAYADPIAAELHVGDTFVADTVEGVPVTYTVSREASNGELGVASVGKGTGVATDTAVAADTTGSITLSNTVSGPDAHTYTVSAIQPYAFANCNRFVGVTIPSTVTSIGKNAFYRCTVLQNVFFDSDASQIVDDGIFSGCSGIRLVVFGGKKANVAFGSSSPDVYYTVCYYETKHDLDIGNVDSRMLIHERALLENLNAGDVRSGVQPELKIGYEWKYENGFSGTTPLTDSCWVYQVGIGFQVKIRVTQGNVSETPCWFRVTSFDESTGTGEVQLGLGKNGITAISTAVRGIPVIPTTVTDEEGNAYRVTSVGDYAFGSTDEVGACQGVTSVNFQSAVSDITSMGQGVFQNCKALTGVNLPVKVASIGSHTFYNCIELSSVNLDKLQSLSVIPEYMFYGDYTLRSLALPSSITSVSSRAFSHCYRYYLDDYGRSHLEGLGSVDVSKARSLKSIAAYAFADNPALQMGALDFPEGFQYVGDGAFYGANASRLTFPSTIAYIGTNAFRYCSSITQITFSGDADHLAIGSGAFYIYLSGDNPGSLGKVVFGGKKFADIESRISTGSYVDRPNYDTGRTYKIYYTVRGYNNIADFDAGKASRKVEVLENSYPYSYDELTTNEYYSWRAEPSFSFYEKTTDSFYLVAGYNLSRATVSGLEDSYAYTGFHLTPPVVLTWVDGRVLEEGTDYVFDTSQGFQHNGYTNNKSMGKATIYMIGIGDFAGQKTADFYIEGTYDSNAAFSNITLSPSAFVYDGTAHTPNVEVSGTIKGREFYAEEGVDYTVSYENNVNASTLLRPAYAVVHGMGMFSSEKRVPFYIMPYNINKCTIRKAEGSYDPLTLTMTLTFQVVSPWGAELVEGQDYSLSYTNSSAVGDASVFVTGIGNYTGVQTLTVTVGGGYGGEGGGRGQGKGTGPGNENGKGMNDVNGTGSSSARSNSDSSSDVATGTLGGDMSPTVSGAAGSASGGSSYSLYALGTDADIVVDIPAIVPYIWLILLLAGLIIAGMCYRGSHFKRQSEAPSGHVPDYHLPRPGGWG